MGGGFLVRVGWESFTDGGRRVGVKLISSFDVPVCANVGSHSHFRPLNTLPSFSLPPAHYPISLSQVWSAVSCDREWVRSRDDPIKELHGLNTFLGGYQTQFCVESLFFVYWIIYSFIGIFLMLSLVIVVFEGTYSSRHEVRREREREEGREEKTFYF